jgi:ABC-type antimicrobial peptide transport system permease subunit
MVRPPSAEPKARAMVVGVVGDTRYNELLRPVPMAYFAYRQVDLIPENYLIRTRSDAAAAALVPALRAAVQEVVPAVAIRRAEPLTDLLRQPLARPRLAALLVTGFGLIVVALSAIGIYSVMASFVAQRTREIGVRMALGATNLQVQQLVFRQGLMLAMVGLALGVLIAGGAGRLVRGLLYEVAPADGLSYGIAVLLLFAVAVAGIAIPALRASRLNPVVALRED